MFDVIAQMLRTGILTEPRPVPDDATPGTGNLQMDLRRILGRALCIRHVDAGSCNGCELEIQALNNPYYNLEGVGIRFVASPRHADLLLVTGPVSVNMEEALKRTYDCIPDPKWVVALGDCGACGGVFGTSYASRGGVANIIPVNFTITGCPPSPASILHGILETVRTPLGPSRALSAAVAPSPEPIGRAKGF
jgi:Ni,Fe-hydrogenase III small subunit